MVTTIKRIHTTVPPRVTLCVCVILLSNFLVFSMVLLIIVTMPCIKSPDFTHSSSVELRIFTL